MSTENPVTHAESRHNQPSPPSLLEKAQLLPTLMKYQKYQNFIWMNFSFISWSLSFWQVERRWPLRQPAKHLKSEVRLQQQNKPQDWTQTSHLELGSQQWPRRGENQRLPLSSAFCENDLEGSVPPNAAFEVSSPGEAKLESKVPPHLEVYP